MRKTNTKTSTPDVANKGNVCILPYSLSDAELYYSDDIYSYILETNPIKYGYGVFTDAEISGYNVNYNAPRRATPPTFNKNYNVEKSTRKMHYFIRTDEIRRPTKNTILKGLGLTKRYMVIKSDDGKTDEKKLLPSLIRENSEWVGEGHQLASRNDKDIFDCRAIFQNPYKVLTFIYTKQFGVAEEKTEKYLYRELKVGDMTRKNRFARKKKLDSKKAKA
jgi:hypothetical protein